MNSTKKTILLVEDNEKIMEANRQILSAAGYALEMATSLEAARNCLKKCNPDAILLDLLLPDGNGIDFIDEIRKYTLSPVLLLTALNEKSDRLAGLRAGGDDYITKPYDLEELKERISAAIRRDELISKKPLPNTISFGFLTLDLISQRAYFKDDEILLSPKEFALLLILLQNEGKVVETETLYREVWKTPMTGDGNALWKQMSNLKIKLEQHSEHLTITTKRGVGYKLVYIK